MVIETINSIGQGVTTTVTLLIQLNHWLNQNVVGLAIALASMLTRTLVAIGAAVHIALEDFAVFLADTHESFVALVEFLFACVDGVVMTAVTSCLVVKSAFCLAVSSTVTSAVSVYGAVYSAVTGLGHMVTLSWSSVVFLLGLAPKTVYALGAALWTAVTSTGSAVLAAVAALHVQVVEAPLEAVTGLAAALLIAASLKRIHARSGMTIALRVFCLVYFYLMKSLIFGARCLIKLVEMTLSHLHVTRYLPLNDFLFLYRILEY